MQQDKKNKRKSRKNFMVDNRLVDVIAHSQQLTESEKLLFLKYAGYYTASEKKELMELI